MQSRDHFYGEALAEYLAAQYQGRINHVKWTYDTFLELDQMSKLETYCTISPNNFTQERQGRCDWSERITIDVTLVSAVGPTDKTDWISEWLGSWDLMLRNLRGFAVEGRKKLSGIDQDQRYDVDAFHNHRRLVTQAALHYLNVEIN